ncbi:MAG: hypothetical protein ACI4EF_08665 [Coprococcus sp.]
MNTIRILYLPDGTRFKDAINNCKGDVFLEMPDNTLCNLKKELSLMTFISSMKPQHIDLQLEYANPNDTSVLFSALA